MISSALIRLRPGMSLVDFRTRLAGAFPDCEVGEPAGLSRFPLVIEAFDANELESMSNAIRSWPEVDSLDVVSVFFDDMVDLQSAPIELEKPVVENGANE